MGLLNRMIKILAGIILLFCANLVWGQGEAPTFTIYASDHYHVILECNANYARISAADKEANLSPNRYILKSSEDLDPDFPISAVSDISQNDTYALKFTTSKKIKAHSSLTLSGDIYLVVYGTDGAYLFSESFVPLFVPSRPSRIGIPYAWGKTSSCGTGTLNTEGLTDVVDIAATEKGSVYLKSDGKVVFRGTDSFSGLDSWTDIVQISASKGVITGIKSDGSVYISTLPSEDFGSWDTVTTDQIPGWDNIVQIDCSEGRVIGLGTNGKIKLLTHTEAELIDQTDFLNLPNIIDVAVSKSHVFVRDKDNILYENMSFSGKTSTENASLLSAGYNQSVCVIGDNLNSISTDSKNYDFTDVSSGNPIIAANVAKIDSGRIHNLFLLKDGTIQVNGNTSTTYKDIVTLPAINDHIIDIAAGAYHSIVLRMEPIIEAASVAESESWTWVPDFSKLPWNNVVFTVEDDLPTGMEFHSETGVLTWNPSQNEIPPGEYAFKIIAADAEDLEQTQQIEFTITVQNSAPVFATLLNPWPVNPGESNILSVIATDSSAIEYGIINAPNGMTIDPETGVLHWTPPVSEAGKSYTVTITASDGDLSSEQELTVVVNNVKLPPEITTVPTGNSAQLTVGTPWSFQLIATDADTATTSLTWSFTTGKTIPSGLTITEAGLLSWTPGNTQCGDYEVWVTVSDGSKEDTKSFDLFVNKINHQPVWTTIPSQSVKTGEKFMINLSTYASDADGDTLGYTVSGAPEDVEINQSTGILSWNCTKQNTTAAKTYTIKVTASDGSSEATQTFALSATYENKAPVITGTKTSVTINECTSTNITSLLGWTFSDPDNDTPLTYTLQNAPSGMNVNNSGVITWNPTESQGPSTNNVTLKVTDSDTVHQGTASKNFKVVVKEVNKAPVLATISAQSVKVGETFTYQLSATDEDIPTQTLTYSLVSGAPTGMNINATGCISWDCTKQNTPTSASHTITVCVSDGALTDTQTFALSATYENKAPVITGTKTSVTINECKTSNITTLLGWTFSDPDGDTLSFDLTDEPNGMSINKNSGIITWTPTESQGPSTNKVTLVVKDSDTVQSGITTKEFTVIVNEVNTAPVFGAIPQIDAEVGIPIYIDTIRATDNDLPAQTLTYETKTTLSGFTLLKNGDILYLPAVGDIGTQTITITCKDNGTPQLAATAQVTISVTKHVELFHFLPISDITIKEHENFYLQLTATGGEGTGSINYAFTSTPPTGMTLTTSGLLFWCPSETDGDKSFPITVRATRGNETASATFTITVDEVNDAPVISDPSQRYTINENTLLAKEITATDPEGKTLTYTIESITPSLSESSNQPYFDGNVLKWQTSEADGSDRTDGSNIYTIVTKVSDPENLSAKATIVVKIKEVNQNPIITTDSNLVAYQGKLFSQIIEAQDNDIPAQKISFKLLAKGNTTLPEGLSIHPYTGTLLWRVKLSTELKSYPFIVEVTDENGGSVHKDFNITVNPWSNNIVGSSVDLLEIIKEGETFEFNLGESVKDYADWFLADGPETALYTPETGILTWTPSELDGGKQFTITLKNRNPNTEILKGISLSIDVIEVNEAPVIHFDPIQAIYPEQEIRIFIYATDSDIPEQDVTLSFVSELPQGATFNPITGEFIWRPTVKQLENAQQLLLEASDSEGLTVQEELVVPSYQLPETGVEVFYSYDNLGNVELAWTDSESSSSESFDIYGISSLQHDTWQKIASIQVVENMITLSASTKFTDSQFFTIRDEFGNICPVHLQSEEGFILLSTEMENAETPYTCYTKKALSSKETGKDWNIWISIDPTKKRFTYNAKISENADGLRSYRVIRSQK